MKECNLVELFSGIGSQYRALNNLGIKVNTLGTSEWDVHAIAAYDVIHNSETIPERIALMTKPELLETLKKYTFSGSGKAPLSNNAFRTYSQQVLQRLLASIERSNNYVDISTMCGVDMPQNIDIMTYSFPCQDLSNVGAFHGYNKGIDKESGSRSSLLWQVGRILSEMKTASMTLPRYLLMENVPTLLSERHFENFKTWIHDLSELGYLSHYYQLNASSFGLPQNRPRLLMISVFVGEDQAAAKVVKEFFSIQTEAGIVSDYTQSGFFHKLTVRDLLRIDYSNDHLLKEAIECTPNDTISRRQIWMDNPQIVKEGYIYNESIDTVRTITTKQDRNPNSGNLYFDSGIEGRCKYRYLTPRECMLFMGFEDSDYDRLVRNNAEIHKGDAIFARDKVIKMSGNSIPVKLLEGIFFQILIIDEMLNQLDESKDQSLLFGDNYNKTIASLKSALFSHGIRSRIPNCEYPKFADLVYPRYKAAVFIRDFVYDGHCQFRRHLDGVSKEKWESLFEKNDLLFNEKMAETKKLGWNPIVIWNNDVLDGNTNDIFNTVFNSIKKH